MRCSKVVINLFADSLRMKAIEIEEYIDENEKPLKPKQLERLQHMNKSMKDRCRRMKEAWREHDPNVHNEDADCLEELDKLVKRTKAEVAETSYRVYTVLSEREQRQQEEKYRKMEQLKIKEYRENQKKHKPQNPRGPKRQTPKHKVQQALKWQNTTVGQQMRDGKRSRKITTH